MITYSSRNYVPKRLSMRQCKHTSETDASNRKLIRSTNQLCIAMQLFTDMMHSVMPAGTYYTANDQGIHHRVDTYKLMA